MASNAIIDCSAAVLQQICGCRTKRSAVVGPMRIGVRRQTVESGLTRRERPVFLAGIVPIAVSPLVRDDASSQYTATQHPLRKAS